MSFYFSIATISVKKNLTLSGSYFVKIVVMFGIEFAEGANVAIRSFQLNDSYGPDCPRTSRERAILPLRLSRVR